MKASRCRTWSLRGVAFMAALLALAFVLAAQAAPLHPSEVRLASTSTTYGGRAYGVGVQPPLGGGTTYADTGSLPASGGFLVADFAPVNVPPVDATVFLSYTTGLLSNAQSEVATSDVTLLAGTPAELDSSFAYATSYADCASTSGTSQIPDLTVGGVAVPVTGAPNQIYQVPGVLELVINEQIVSSSGTLESITVNALDLTVTGVGEFVVASAQSAMDCGSASTSVLPTLALPSTGTGDVTAMWATTADFVTGGGYFFAGNFGSQPSTCPGDRVNFGFNAGPRPGTFPTLKGHVNVVDHGGAVCPMQHFEGTDVTDYGAVGDPQNVCRFAAGDATANGAPGFRYNLGVCDYGEPGRNDRFDFEVFDATGTTVYFVSNARAPGTCPPNEPYCGDLPGGNIQLHTFSTS